MYILKHIYTRALILSELYRTGWFDFSSGRHCVLYIYASRFFSLPFQRADGARVNQSFFERSGLGISVMCAGGRIKTIATRPPSDHPSNFVDCSWNADGILVFNLCTLHRITQDIYFTRFKLL